MGHFCDTLIFWDSAETETSKLVFYSVRLQDFSYLSNCDFIIVKYIDVCTKLVLCEVGSCEVNPNCKIYKPPRLQIFHERGLLDLQEIFKPNRAALFATLTSKRMFLVWIPVDVFNAKNYLTIQYTFLFVDLAVY